MKKLQLLLMACLLLPALLLARTGLGQAAKTPTSSLTFFTENGDPFWAVVNGIRQNLKPETNVKITGLKDKMVKVKIVFQDEKKGAADKTCQLVGVDSDFNDIVYSINYNNKKKRWDFKMVSWEVAEGSPKPAEEPVAGGRRTFEVPYHTDEKWQPLPVPMPVTHVKVDPDGKTSMEISMGGNTTPNPGTATPAPATPAGSPARVQSPGVDPVHAGNSRQHHGRDNTQLASQPAAVVPVANPAAPQGCQSPMAGASFQQALASIQKASFASDRLKQAKNVARNNCLSIEQVKLVMKSISYESDRLDFAKYAYNRCTDRPNYYLVNDAFSYSSSRDELNDFIEAGR